MISSYIPSSIPIEIVPIVPSALFEEFLFPLGILSENFTRNYYKIISGVTSNSKIFNNSFRFTALLETWIPSDFFPGMSTNIIPESSSATS